MRATQKTWQALKGAFAFCWAFVCGWHGLLQCSEQGWLVFNRHRTQHWAGFLLQIGTSVPFASPFFQWFFSAWELGGSQASQRCLKTIPWVQANWQPVQPTPPCTSHVASIPSGTRGDPRMSRKPSLSPSSSQWSISGQRGVDLTWPIREIVTRIEMLGAGPGVIGFLQVESLSY